MAARLPTAKAFGAFAREMSLFDAIASSCDGHDGAGRLPLDSGAAGGTSDLDDCGTQVKGKNIL